MTINQRRQALVADGKRLEDLQQALKQKKEGFAVCEKRCGGFICPIHCLCD
jgi:hypothetical protein